MRRYRQLAAAPGTLLFLAALASATGCQQEAADKSTNPAVTQAIANEQTTETAAAVKAPAGEPPAAAEVGSPSASRSLPGNQLPPPDPKFGGKIELKAADSKAWWAPRVVPPKGAPNVLLIMTDDCGFGSPSTFGGVIPTPSLERIAKN